MTTPPQSPQPESWLSATLNEEECGFAAPSLAEACPHLLILNGTQQGQRFPLQKSDTTLGRDACADILIEDDLISRIHCRLHRSGGEVIIEDADSHNRIHVDGEPVDRCVLTPFSQLRVGHTLMRIDCRTPYELEMEKALVESERMAAVGILAAGVAHQFNNINTATLGYAEIALSMPDLPAQLREYLEVIQQSAQRAETITRDILSFAGKQGETKAPRQLNRLIRQAVGVMKEELKEEDIDLAQFLSPLPESVMDGGQISQLIIHLLVNARHSLIDRLERRIEIWTETNEDNLHLSVRDTGCGIAPEQMDKLFMPFFSGKGEHCEDRGPQSKVRGVGLGLSVAKAIATRHGGELLVESEVGIGSTFTLVLPCRDAEAFFTEASE